MVSTHKGTHIARRGKITTMTTAYGSTGVLYLSTVWTHGTTLPPGFIYATANTYINFPIKAGVDDLMFYILYDSPCTGSTTCYPAVSVQMAPSSVGGFNGSTGDSTKEAAFKRFYSTACFQATSTSCEGFTFGPIDSKTFGCQYEGTSSGDVDKYQRFIRMMVGYSTATTCTHDALSTNAPVGGYYILPIAVGSTKENA